MNIYIIFICLSLNITDGQTKTVTLRGSAGSLMNELGNSVILLNLGLT